MNGAECIGGGSSRDCERGECNALAACVAAGESTSARLRRVLDELDSARAAAEADNVEHQRVHGNCLEREAKLINRIDALATRLADALAELEQLRANIHPTGGTS